MLVTVILEDPSLPSAFKKCGDVEVEFFADKRDPVLELGAISKHRFEYLTRHQTLIEDLRRAKPELVFNLCDQGFGNDASRELHLPALLEVLGLPYTGATPSCLALAYDKVAASALARSVGVAVPGEACLQPGTAPPWGEIRYPALVKPCFGDGSYGIFGDSLVRDEAALKKYLKHVEPFGLGPLLAQEYLEGPEYCVIALGNPGQPGFQILPWLEKDYSKFGPDYPPITGYEAKWFSQNAPFPYDLELVPARLAEPAQRELAARVERLFARFGCRDYAKFDFRTSASGEIKLIDVNPNFDLYADSLIQMGQMAGLSHGAIFDKVLDSALARYRGAHAP